ncbi:uncharacterized protein BP01DRAFT_383874 [Aspergillus saccharolyticus JOP 1030-1]|uniref:Uncharacterized protein n=1 Tax=Aspergillus saccharolyticus JOP 1030-1 TaxID=1450539 RepID=A0A318ZHM6_9EURO|nr:hypothetical protein BP01DRAFT_383874 [Aspergillus saccharolyticus JOP 1030-1]PYH44073.1 hypothetical protein BP01DRAFT_383874 [Aspergillus saccharolyticus JOP 1030-1]
MRCKCQYNNDTGTDENPTTNCEMCGRELAIGVYFSEEQPTPDRWKAKPKDSKLKDSKPKDSKSEDSKASDSKSKSNDDRD